MITPRANKKIFIGNLPLAWDESTIFSTFVKFGLIIEIKLMRSRRELTSLGYGFILFDSEISAKDAIDEMNGVIQSGRSLRYVRKKGN